MRYTRNPTRPLRWFGGLIVFTGVLSAALAITAGVAAATPPTVAAEWSSEISEHNATLEAQINPESAENGAIYQFQLVRDTSEFQPTLTCPAEL